MDIKIYLDGANLDSMQSTAHEQIVSGFTSNPTLIRSAGVDNYLAFCRQFVSAAAGKPASLEILADEPDEILRQARILSAIEDSVYVKVPATTTNGLVLHDVVTELLDDGVKVNVTALMTEEHIRTFGSYASSTPLILSIFAGRIADTGRDPQETISMAISECAHNPAIEILWASPREVYNVYQAEELGCHIITLPSAMLEKLHLKHKSLDEFSLETVQMFYDDAVRAGYVL